VVRREGVRREVGSSEERRSKEEEVRRKGERSKR